MPGLLHHLDHFVKAYAVFAVGKSRVAVGIHGPGRRKGVALDTRNLHQTANGIAGEPKVVLQPHFGRIFDLGRRAAEQLTGRCSGHCTSNAYLSLTPHLGS